MTILELVGGIIIAIIFIADWFVLRELQYKKTANAVVIPMGIAWFVLWGLVVFG